MNTSKTLLGGIDMLKTTFEKEKDVEKVVNAFFEFCARHDISKLGVPGRNPKLERALESLALRLLPPDVDGCGQMCVVYCPSLSLYHGLIATALGPGVFFYFDDLDRGACSLPGRGGVVNYLRFSFLPGASADAMN